LILPAQGIGWIGRIQRLHGGDRGRVTDVRIVDTRRTRLVLDANAALLTLVTCYPFDAINPGGPLRWLVTAAERLKSKTYLPTVAAAT